MGRRQARQKAHRQRSRQEPGASDGLRWFRDQSSPVGTGPLQPERDLLEVGDRITHGGKPTVSLDSVRTIDWVDGAVEIIDQTALPDEVRVLRLSTVDGLVDAIRVRRWWMVSGNW